MVDRFVEDLVYPISRIRIEKYRPPGGTNLDMVVNYFWNIELSKAFYPSLQALEVSLRNGIHTAATRHYDGDDYWFDRPNVLLDRQASQLLEARKKLQTSAQSRDQPNPAGRPTADDIVAAMSFGFWVGLFNTLYESPLPPAAPEQLTWFDEKSRPTALFRETFPAMAKRFQSRKVVGKRLNKFLKLRNRVFHYEPIWRYEWLPRHHTEILETISWIQPEMRDAIALCDEFLEIHAGGRAILEAKLNDRFGVS